jgi:hypothetical protein
MYMRRYIFGCFLCQWYTKAYTLISFTSTEVEIFSVLYFSPHRVTTLPYFLERSGVVVKHKINIPVDRLRALSITLWYSSKLSQDNGHEAGGKAALIIIIVVSEVSVNTLTTHI